jgi:NAD(P)-dependent dehydrogenase (short-subunit alcohol dehydrogenase family)
VPLGGLRRGDDDRGTEIASNTDRFGRLDVLVNNAGNFYAGFFEEIRPEESRAQIETTLFGRVIEPPEQH